MQLRKLRLSDVVYLVDWWLREEHRNACDLRVIDNPRFDAVVVNEKTYVTFQPVVMLESVAFSPEATPKERLVNSLAGVKEVERQAVESGIKEVYYMSSDDRTDEVMKKHLGYEEVRCLRKRL